ncbi:hypothetical protein [Vibrio natriegens]|uniref:DUF4376 domain-containing protein n=1 Tax=Vibrio natriegens NBRC 15636 = ATCC 14048 = DSM 759 TaxID=1219067 RepID=A0AAN0Y1X9_VIBNA|nr:hypothetical protein [Vibrio natriegens]ANQ12421.1 hypothetical protein BA890_06465 [Vibrio natriegens NBRC 15636 = ATCC 14048 = DSM 759]EPM42480.1 hypothetical protein M272_00510 [Vibrio natriegens NBRC 15636 = ATCC 14048 = DSM 759]MDX6026802.1 hypothetical protein [Vibrio natriegens NBRC 15636 = ATCC 14048 = DSM 759]UUI12884.1 hypothetical protein NP431_06475 [Vibrio natriegens]
MKPWLIEPYYLAASTREELEQALADAFGIDEQGETLMTSHIHSVTLTTPMVETGNLVSDGEGNEFPEMAPKDGAYAEVRVREPVPELSAFAEMPNPSVAEYYESLSQQTRFDAEFDLLPFGEVFIQTGMGKDGIRGIDRLKGVMTEVSIHPEKVDDVINWIAADNSVVELTYQDVTALISAFNTRQQALFNQYAQWRTGDKQDPFFFY